MLIIQLVQWETSEGTWRSAHSPLKWSNPYPLQLWLEVDMSCHTWSNYWQECRCLAARKHIIKQWLAATRNHCNLFRKLLHLSIRRFAGELCPKVATPKCGAWNVSTGSGKKPNSMTCRFSGLQPTLNRNTISRTKYDISSSNILMLYLD